MANTNKANDPNNETCTKECKICGFSIAGSTKQIMMRRFFYHLNTHNTSVKDYYDRYEKDNIDKGIDESDNQSFNDVFWL